MKNLMLLFVGMNLLNLSSALHAQIDSSQLTKNSEFINVRARISSRDKGHPLTGTACFLSVPGKNFELSAATTDTLGNAIFPLRKANYARQIVVQAFPVADTAYHVDLPEPVVLPVKNGAINALSTESRLYIEDTLPFYGVADKVYLLDNYTRFPTLQEVLSEFIPEVRVRKQRSHYWITVLDVPFMTFFENQPLLLVDGLPARSDKLMELDPLKIARIEVTSRKYYFGSLKFDGIVSFRSYNGDLAGYPVDSDARVTDIPASSEKK